MTTIESENFGHDSTSFPIELIPRTTDLNRNFSKQYVISRSIQRPNIDIENIVQNSKILESELRKDPSQNEAIFYDFICIKNDAKIFDKYLISKFLGPKFYFSELERLAIESGEEYDLNLWEFELETRKNLYFHIDENITINKILVNLKKKDINKPICPDGYSLLIMRTTLLDYHDPYSSTSKYIITPLNADGTNKYNGYDLSFCDVL
jgi:hypothetical protein